jgi:serine protease
MYKQIPLMSTVFSRSLCLMPLVLLLFVSVLPAQHPEIIPGEFVIKIRAGVAVQEDLSRGKTGVRAVDDGLIPYRIHNIKRFCPRPTIKDHRGLARILEISSDADVDPVEFVSRLRSLDEVEYAEPRYLRTTKRIGGSYRGQSFPMGGDELPNDPYFPLQWALSYINAPAAWDIVTGDSTIVIANVDVGVDLDHPDLAQILWRNLPELDGLPGVDDDGNGWIDDIYGWDFLDNDPNPRPANGDVHGTHTASTAIAATNNGVGVAGVSRDCRLMSVRAGTSAAITMGYAGIYYAAHTGAKIISLSWGGEGYSQFEKDVVDDAHDMGAILVAAAGNSSNDVENYPAAFDGVIAVAAIDETGKKADFSNYGIWVDIAAPGENILSAIPNSQWTYLSGTSMATPVVAGVAALVASLHPDWESEKVMSAVIASGNPLDDVNPVFGSGLGTGCVNAFRAVDGGRGGMMLDSLSYDDTIGGNGNGIPESGEMIRLLVWLKNDLTSESDVIGKIIENLPGLTILASQSDFGPIPAGEIGENLSNPYQFTIAPGVGSDQRFRLSLELRDQNDRRLRKIPIQFIANPSFADHNVGDVVLTVTGFGAFGYEDYLIQGYAEPRGNGFKYPRNGPSWLYHGSWMIGNDREHVSDDAYGDATFSRFDFVTAPGGELIISGPGVSDQDGIATFTDDNATNPMGIQVVQQSYAWADSPDDRYVIATASVQNLSTQTLSTLYIGLFMDWDVGPYVQNVAGWEANHAIGWMTNNVFPSPYVGLARVDGAPASYRVIDNNQVIYTQGFPDSTKYQYMSEGIVVDFGQEDGDWSILLSTGPYSLAPEETATAAFAIGAGDNLQLLTASMDAARNKYSQIAASPKQYPASDLATWELSPVYPNPFNSAGKIQLITHRQSDITLSLYNILGQKVGIIFQGAVKEGVQMFDINSTHLSSGKYYCRLEAPGYTSVRPLVVIK